MTQRRPLGTRCGYGVAVWWYGDVGVATRRSNQVLAVAVHGVEIAFTTITVSVSSLPITYSCTGFFISRSLLSTISTQNQPLTC